MALALLAGGAELTGGVLLTAALLDWAGAGWAVAASVVGAAGSLLMLGLARIGHRTRRGGPQPHAA